MDSATPEVKVSLDIEKIREMIPHRYPFLLVDRVLELGEKHIVAVKNVTANEPHFTGHFPQQMVMPGVLQLEAMAQAGCIWLLAKPEHRGKIAFLMSIKEAKFRRPVVPGDQMRIEANVVMMRTRRGTVEAKCIVDGKVVSEATIMFAFGPSGETAEGE